LRNKLKDCIIRNNHLTENNTMKRFNNQINLISEFLDKVDINDESRAGTASYKTERTKFGGQALCFYSYSTIVAYWYDGKLHITSKPQTQTTTRQVNSIKRIASIKNIQFISIDF